MKCSILGIEIQVVNSKSEKWNKALAFLLKQQLNGFEKIPGKHLYSIEIRDIEELKDWKPDSVVPGAYGYKEGLFYDYSKQTAIRQDLNKLEYWCKASVAFSVHYLIHLALIETERCFIHAAGISVKGEGVLFPAFGGIGKTLIVGDLLREDGVQLLGDDIIAIGRDGTASSYPRPFCLYEYHKAIFPQYYAKQNLSYLRPSLFWRIYKRLRWEILARTGMSLPGIGSNRTHKHDYVLAPPAEIFGSNKLETRAVPIKKILWLSRNSKINEIRISSQSDKKPVADFSVDVTQHEWTAYYKSQLGYLLHKGVSEIDYKLKIMAIVNQGFQKSDEIIRIEIPEGYSKEKLVKAVREVLHLRIQ